MGLLDRVKALLRPSPGTVRESMTFVGRARLIVNLFDEFGESASEEFGQDPPLPGFEPLLVFEFGPTEGRPFWTYTTAGMSLCPALDGHPPTELVAYASERAQSLVDVLFQLAVRDPTAMAYAVGDIAVFDEPPPDLGLALGNHVGFAPVPENDDVLDFPNLETRPEDLRYTMARPREDATTIRFLRAVALTDADSTRFTAQFPALADTRAWALY